MPLFTITHPTASLARGIENLVIYSHRSSRLVGGICERIAGIISAVVFPLFVILELTLMRFPKMVKAIGTPKFQRKSNKALKYLLSIVPAILLGTYSPEGVPGFFLKRRKTTKEIRPFGVEKIYGKSVEGGIHYPKDVSEVQKLVKEAKEKKGQVSVIGAGMSQGTQTVPKASNQRVINTKHLNSVTVNLDENTVTVGAGASWEKVQLELDKSDKSAIVKQASDIFSIGGSIGINCHGWAHQSGAIAKTVRSLTMVDANGDIQVLERPREGVPMEDLTEKEKLFKCMFGTLGYFGIVTEATFDIVDNEILVETAELVRNDEFHQAYEKLKSEDIPLFGGRLVLDKLNGDPLRNVCMVSYRKPAADFGPSSVSARITVEPKSGRRIHRVGLKLISQLPDFLEKRLMNSLWKREKAAMFAGKVLTRNEALHPPINAFKILHHSDLHAQWLQEYFIEKDKIGDFLKFLGSELKTNDVRLINATVRPTPKDDISILPYAEKDRYAVVICFAQKKTETEIAKTRQWIEKVNAHLAKTNGVFYQAYMPFATIQQFETCYGPERVEEMRKLKDQFDPDHVFGNAHTAKYYDRRPESAIRKVFDSKEQRKEFVMFLKTIFYQLDDKKVLEEMDKILADSSKSNEQVYEELVANIDKMRKRFPAVFHKLKSLSVLQKGMGLQAASLMKDFRGEQFHNYLEVYFRRHLKTIQKTAKLSLDGKIYAASDNPYNGSIKEKLEASSLFSFYPYKKHVALNDSDCTSPENQPEKTHKPLGNEVEDGEIDLLSCLGGLHHIPKERTDAFVKSMHQKLKPGGVVLFRDHDASTPELSDIASAVHTFVNAADGVKWDVENKEIREFRSSEYWTNFMKERGFTQVSSDNLILKDDPTKNGMMAFMKTPENLEELRTATKYRKNCIRSPDGTRATWIEWGNVRSSKQYAEFVQTKHSYAFDQIGHLRQHWKYFTSYLKESRKDLPIKDIIFSDNFTMNLFILIATTFQCIAAYLGNIPSMLIARIKDGVDWRNATNLTALEKYEAGVEKEYSEFIDHTPFYMFPYLSKIAGLWKAIWNSKENLWVKLNSSISAVSSTLGFVVKAAVCAPVRSMCTKDGQYVEPDSVAILIHDPDNQFESGEKSIGGKKHNIKVIYESTDHHKLIFVPRYRPFTELCKELVSDVNNTATLVEIGSQTKVTVDVLHDKEDVTIKEEQNGVEFLYEMDKLQDLKGRRYATYQVDIAHLAAFEQKVGADKIEYVHE